MNSTNLNLGAKVTGTVVAIQQYYATIQQDGQLGMAVVHISQLSDTFLSPPMNDHVSVGDRLDGLVVDVDRKTGYPEISPKKLLYLAARGLTGLLGEPEACKISKANEFYALVQTLSGTGLLANPAGPWSRYEVLLASGLRAKAESW